MTTAKATYEVSDWQEETAHDIGDGAKLTRASWTQRYTGDIEGDETVQCLMHYGADGSVTTIGLSHFRGRVGERTGEFATQSVGGFADGQATATTTVLDGSGTGELAGLRGKGKTEVGHDMAGSVTFKYELD